LNLFKKHWPYFIYGLLTLAITLPLFRSGFIFLLDGTFSPSLDLTDILRGGLSPSLPLIGLIKLVSLIVPLEVLHKLLFSLVLLLPGILMYRFTRESMAKEWAFLSGLFYTINPWVLERFISGQWFVLLGYAFLPLLIGLFFKILQPTPTRENYIRFTILFAVFPLLSLHFAYIGIFLLGLLFVLYFSIHKGQLYVRWKSILTYGLLSIVVLCIVNSFWIIHFTQPTATLPQITFNDFYAYTTTSDPVWGPYFNVASLYGFWNQDIALPKDLNSLWWLNTIVVLLLSLFGFYSVVRRKNVLGIALGIIFIPSLVVAVGLASPISANIVKTLYLYLPGFKGLRDTEKIAGLLALTYAFLLPFGAYFIAHAIARGSRAYFRFSKTLPYLFILILPFSSTFSIFWGASGYIPVAPYPSGWYAAEKALQASQSSDKVLFLPWRGYTRPPFADFHLIASPAQGFFTNELIVSKDEGNDNLVDVHTTPWDKKMFQLLQGFETLEQNKNFLQQERVTHIILAKENDWERYLPFLENSPLLQKVLDSESLVLFEVTH